MAKVHVVEIAGICVAGSTRAWEVICRRAVAGGTIRIADGAVVKRRIAEIAGVAVAGAARSLVMVGWRRVAR